MGGCTREHCLLVSFTNIHSILFRNDGQRCFNYHYIVPYIVTFHEDAMNIFFKLIEHTNIKTHTIVEISKYLRPIEPISLLLCPTIFYQECITLQNLDKWSKGCTAQLFFGDRITTQCADALVGRDSLGATHIPLLNLMGAIFRRGRNDPSLS